MDENKANEDKTQKKQWRKCAEELSKKLHAINCKLPSSLDDEPAPELLLSRKDDAGIFFGGEKQYDKKTYVGMPKGADGNILVIGGSGSGKSTGIVQPTLQKWDGAICATDIKGELSAAYQSFYDRPCSHGKQPRPYIVFDPSDPEGPSYDPFWWVSQDTEENFLSNIQEISYALFPAQPDALDSYWTDSERAVVSAALSYYYRLGLSFSEAVCLMLNTPTSTLCETIAADQNVLEVGLLGEICKMKEDQLASIDRGIRNHLIELGLSTQISHAFRGSHEDAVTFNWRDLEEFNIFLRVPEDKLDQWGKVLILMYTQLIRYLERRPEKYSLEGQNNVQTLLLMDEFARCGKLECIAGAVSTLRSKSVNICLVLQSIAQLDQVYGEATRRTILDNCQYTAILGANDAETQKYLSVRIGTRLHYHYSLSQNLRGTSPSASYSVHVDTVREADIPPHALGALEDVLLVTPYNAYLLDKHMPSDTAYSSLHSHSCCQKMNRGAHIMSIEERNTYARERAASNAAQKRREARADRQAAEKLDKQRIYAVGQHVAEFFPDILSFELGHNQYESAEALKPLDAVLAALAEHRCMIDLIAEKALRDFRNSTAESPECVTGHAQGAQTESDDKTKQEA